MQTDLHDYAWATHSPTSALAAVGATPDHAASRSFSANGDADERALAISSDLGVYEEV